MPYVVTTLSEEFGRMDLHDWLEIHDPKPGSLTYYGPERPLHVPQHMGHPGCSYCGTHPGREERSCAGCGAPV